MLDTDTKRRIDSARDILVGKVPDPKSQVEQITIALIYKFMADMDAESEEMGGKRTFFKGEWERFGWPKLMHSGLGGHEVLALYGEAISKMPENAGIPALFRDIFKNAYLPYRDPETLKSFLKIIDEFEYDHSERLGDAFEYLLSVLGSQGDAGQFRTPRHIIDFMVEIVDPKKDETILDPACGTAGFLISSYKHILKNNQDKKGNSTLTPDEKEQLVQNIKGYDISPDMVRLSLVNLYLHGFPDPHIEEYDTLTSDDKWNEFTVCCLANPPFMSPKGGIKPHKRFSINSKRSEVLFVDYISEHLTPNGRAAIVVPEGIIFQSQNAYKQLRQKLVDDYLIAVVSLPAGVFQPYSGVKTSILIIDKPLARLSDTIAFFKVENDGYSLGAQRREIEKNDLPQIQSELTAYYKALLDEKPVQDLQPTLGLIVEKEKIAENGEYNLSGERYQEVDLNLSEFPRVQIKSVVTTITPPTKIPKTKFGEQGAYPIIDQSQENIAGWTDNESALVIPDQPLVIFGDHTCAIKLLKTPFAQGADGIKILRPTIEIQAEYLYYTLMWRPLESDGYKRHFSKLKEYKIPLPPLKVQKEIVAEIEGYQKVIDGARTVLDNYRPHIPIHPDWPLLRFEDAPFEIIDGDRGTNYPKKKDFSPSGYCLFLNTKNVRPNGFAFKEVQFVSKEKDKLLRKGKLNRGDVLLTTRGTIGNTGFYDDSVEYDHIRINSGMLIFRPDDSRLKGNYLYNFFQSENFRIQREAIVSGAAQPQLPIRSLKDATIPLPPLKVQQSIVAEIEAEQSLVAANQELIQRMEKKIQTAIARVWGEDETTA